MTSRNQLQETLCNRLFWHTAERDDAKVADYLFHRHEMDVVYAMDEATLFDSFFNYLRDIQVFLLLEPLDSEKQQRKNVPFSQILLVFLMKVVEAIKKMDQMTDLLLTDELLMNMCGFNAYQVKKGSCKRGEKLRKTYVPESRGALCVDTVANHIVTISSRKIENFFNRCIQCLAKQGIFPKGIKLDTIEKPDNLHVLAVLEQAKENVKPSSTIDSLVLDRGFLDSKVLYDIDLQGIEFVIPLKKIWKLPRMLDS